MMEPWAHVHQQLLDEIHAKIEEIRQLELNNMNPALAFAYHVALRQLEHALTCDKCRGALLEQGAERN